MKYDRPVWQIMHQCADALGSAERQDPVRYEDVRDWFSTNYPDVHEATIRAHLIGLTEGGRAKHVQFAQRSPVFRRLARGEYEAIPRAERGENPDAPSPSASRVKLFGSVRPSVAAASDQPAVEQPLGKARESSGHSYYLTPPAPPSPDEQPQVHHVPVPPAGMEHARELHEFDVVLLGSLGDRVQVPAPAKDIFRARDFQLSRSDEEAVGSRWFVLSAEHGLVEPDEWMSPDARTLADLDPQYRLVWAAWVVARLQSLVGPLDDLSIRVDAPDAFVGPLFAELQQAGAVVSTHTAPWSGEADELAAVVPLPDVKTVSAFLADPAHAIDPHDLSSVPSLPGLYGWSVDPIGARELNRCLRLPVRAGLIFVGPVGLPAARLVADPVLTLREHLDGVQLRGRSRACTFRMTLATVLRDHLRLSSPDDARLLEWMMEHLMVTVWPVDDATKLADLESRVVADLEPPLNIDRAQGSAYRERLTQLSSALA